MKLQNVTYTQRIDARNRNYFIDLKKASNGRDYVCITESKPDGEEGYSKIRMVLFQEDLFRFQDALNKVAGKFDKQAIVPTDIIEKAQETHANAFNTWTKDDDAQLVELFNAESTVEQLAKHFMRSENSIIKRLEKYGLEATLQAA